MTENTQTFPKNFIASCGKLSVFNKLGIMLVLHKEFLIYHRSSKPMKYLRENYANDFIKYNPKVLYCKIRCHGQTTGIQPRLSRITVGTSQKS